MCVHLTREKEGRCMQISCRAKNSYRIVKCGKSQRQGSIVLAGAARTPRSDCLVRREAAISSSGVPRSLLCRFIVSLLLLVPVTFDNHLRPIAYLHVTDAKQEKAQLIAVDVSIRVCYREISSHSLPGRATPVL
jgi:hypothetical protein